MTEEHYQTYLRGYELAKEEGERVGLRVILGMEIRLECDWRIIWYTA